MSAFKPMTWDPDFFLLRCGNGAVIRQRRKERIILAAIFLLSTALPGLWLRQVTKYVPEPYLVITSFPLPLTYPSVNPYAGKLLKIL